MSEERSFEVYECQSYSRVSKWQPHNDFPWATKDPPAPCVPLKEITLPNEEWVWSSEWKIETIPGATDDEGWEYASRLSRFLAENRQPKAEAHQWSTVRRRLWRRSMRREIGIRTADIPKALQKIQTGLASIHNARVRIEEIMKQAPQVAESEQMATLVGSVKKNIGDVITSLDQISAHQHKNGSPQTTTTAAVKKLRNDVMKEEIAIDRALNPGKNSPNINSNRDFLRLQSKSQSNSFVESRGGPGTSSSPPRSKNPVMMQRGSSFAGSGSNRPVSSTKMPTLNEMNEGNFSKPMGTGVKSGRADTFNPAVLHSGSGGSSGTAQEGESERGLFVDRSKKELQIAQKFIPVDEATVMQEIIEERDVEIKKVHSGLVQVNEMFQDLARLVKEQEVEIEQIFKNADESHAKTKNALEHIVEADRLQKAGNCVIS
mmetsp:Transcript_35632/g.70859  ORF Transcript_35632/g.70859 Transcript_35632/m.70859 type:complete len:432 (-) Transcript_35632:51-1346(-)